MKKHEIEVTQAELDAEKKVLRDLEKQYQTALKDIDDKVAQLLGRSDADMPNVIYQVQHQKALRSQIHGILEQLQANEFQTVSDYLTASYQEGFIGTMYSLHNQGIPMIIPIDQDAMIKAVTTNSRLSEDLYTSLGVDIKTLNNSVRTEISRGIAAGLSYGEITRNIANASKAPRSRAATIVRTEAHRIREEARHDGQVRAKEKGAEIVKRWDATLDGATRPHHRKLDGQIREIDEPFEIGNLKAMYPGDFGRPEEDINCRCRARTKAAFLLGEADLHRMQERAEYFGLDKNDDFNAFRKKYMNAANTQANNLVKAGRIEANGLFVHKNELLYKYAQNIKPIDGFEDFTCHADPDGFWIDLVGKGKDEDMIFLTPEEYAERLQNSSTYKGGNIRIISCQSGAEEDGAAQRLANAMGKVIIAPTEIVNVDENGEMFLTDNDILADLWYNSSREERAKMIETGKWIEFKPRKE